MLVEQPFGFAIRTKEHVNFPYILLDINVDKFSHKNDFGGNLKLKGNKMKQSFEKFFRPNVKTLKLNDFVRNDDDE